MRYCSAYSNKCQLSRAFGNKLMEHVRFTEIGVCGAGAGEVWSWLDRLLHGIVSGCVQECWIWGSIYV